MDSDKRNKVWGYTILKRTCNILDWKVGCNYADCPLHGDYEREKKIGKTNPHLKAKKKKILILSLKLKNEKFWLEF